MFRAAVHLNGEPEPARRSLLLDGAPASPGTEGNTQAPGLKSMAYTFVLADRSGAVACSPPHPRGRVAAGP